MESKLPKTNCNISMPEVKPPKEKYKCDSCIHLNVCAYSEKFERLVKEMKEKSQLAEYEHFTVTIGCEYYQGGMGARG